MKRIHQPLQRERERERVKVALHFEKNILHCDVGTATNPSVSANKVDVMVSAIKIRYL